MTKIPTEADDIVQMDVTLQMAAARRCYFLFEVLDSDWLLAPPMGALGEDHTVCSWARERQFERGYIDCE